MDDDPIALISSNFNPTEPGFQDADLVLLTTDAVFFYAHTAVLLKDSSNNFGNMIAAQPVDEPSLTRSVRSEAPSDDPPKLKLVICDYSSEILELVLNTVYKYRTESLAPSTATLQGALAALVS
ncbi:hypothetical protein FRC07_011251, partial [Ceratobasidium sp. 392]